MRGEIKSGAATPVWIQNASELTDMEPLQEADTSQIFSLFLDYADTL